MKTKIGKLIVISILLVSILKWSYDTYLLRIIQNNTNHSQEIFLNQQPTRLLLIKQKEQKKIIGLELEFSGQVMNNLSYSISPIRRNVSSEIKVKKGIIAHEMYVPWHSDSCFLIINRNTGKIQLTYRFISE